MTDDLITQIPESELRETWEILAEAGADRNGLKNIRTYPEYAKAVVKAMHIRHSRTNCRYPRGFQPPSIVEQIKALQKVSAFAELDASWALNDGQEWYNDLKHPEWVEQPLVYVWYESVGGYLNTLDIVLSAIAKERKFYNYRKGQLTPERLRQRDRTREAELKLKVDQPGDFLIVPSQAGKSWGGYSAKETQESFDQNEFGHGSLVVGCLALTHPNRLVHEEELDMDCPGDEFDDPDDVGRFGRVPSFGFYGDKVRFGANRVGHASVRFGSVSGYVPQ